jgi:chromosome segregation ATPase
MEELQSAIKDAERSMEENAQRNTILCKEKDARITELEKELGRVNDIKHEILQQYEEKVGSVLSNLHELERKFSSQKEQHDRELETLKARYEGDLQRRCSEVSETREKLESQSKKLQERQMKADADAVKSEKVRLESVFVMIDTADSVVALEGGKESFS